MRASRTVLAIVVTLPLLGSCGSGSPGADQPVASSSPDSYDPTPADFRAVRTLLEARASAVLHHDHAAFMATVDPDAGAETRARQASEYRNLRDLPVDAISYTVEDTGFEPDGDVPGDDPVMHPGLHEHVRIRATLAKAVTNPVDADFVRRDGHWYLGSEREPRNEDDFQAAEARPWFGGRIDVAARDGVTVLTDRGSDVGAGDLLALVLRDERLDGAVLGMHGIEPVLVDATSNGNPHLLNAGGEAQAGATMFPLVATSPDGRTARGLAGHLIKANPDDVDQLVSDVVTLRHEITHLILHRYGGAVPKWASEGIAEYVGYYPGRSHELTLPSTAAADLPQPVELPDSGSFGVDPRVDYGLAESAVHYLVTTRGMAHFLRFLQAFRDDYRGPFGDAVMGHELRRFYDLTPAILAAYAVERLPR